MRTVLRVLAVAVILSLPIVYSSCADGGGGRTGPDPLPAETLASFDLSVPDSITEGEGFSLTVTAVGSRGTKPLTSYSGTAFLSTTLGTVSPSSLAVSNGAGSGQVTLSTPGPQTLTASGGGRTGSVGVEVTDLPDPTIPGDPNATMEQAVQDSVYLPDPEDYSIGHPEFSGVHLSHNTILVAFKAGTTVGEANDLLVPFGADLVGAIQGVSGAVATILILKLPTENHLELDTVLAELRNSDLVVEASADALMQPLAVPGDKSGRPFDWTWEVEPEGGNWGLELSRVPQMWNLNGALSKAEALVWTGVYDVGFIDGHEDLPPDLPFINLSPSVLNDHGNLSAGIIGAKFNNPVGIDGVNPFSGLIVQASTWSSATGPSESASLAQSLTNLATLMDQYPEIRVLNISMGYTQEVDTNTDLAWQQKVDADGLLFAEVLRGVGMNQPVPLITAAAGNESNLGFGLQSARYASPYCNAAFEHAVHSVLCIENVEYDKDGVGQAKRWTTSNVGGHFSAPGTEVRTTGVSPDGYPLATGTSSAAPLAAGVVGYMLAVEPTLTIPQIREALFRTSIPVGGFANNRIDAWAAVMEIDRVKGGDKVLKMMLDIDDGTPDGNQRVDYSDQPEFPDYEEEDADEDGGIGDGKVDMSDFRRWRDWVLILEDPDDLALDGEMDHPKHDVNGNGQVDLPAQEEIYPRGDFNGDGKLSTDEEDKA
ncbi:MAG: S8 family serine peptidase, partial [Gemmatimonadota bacterium]